MSFESLAQFICVADLLIRFDEHTTFQRYMISFIPQFQSVSRNTSMTDIVTY